MSTPWWEKKINHKRDIEVILHKCELWFDIEGVLAFLYEATLVLQTIKSPKNIKYPWYKLDRSRSTPKIASNNKITWKFIKTSPQKRHVWGWEPPKAMTSCSRREKVSPKAMSLHQRVQSLSNVTSLAPKIMSHHHQVPTHHQKGISTC